MKKTLLLIGLSLSALLLAVVSRPSISSYLVGSVIYMFPDDPNTRINVSLRTIDEFFAEINDVRDHLEYLDELDCEQILRYRDTLVESTSAYITLLADERTRLKNRRYSLSQVLAENGAIKIRRDIPDSFQNELREIEFKINEVEKNLNYINYKLFSTVKKLQIELMKRYIYEPCIGKKFIIRQPEYDKKYGVNQRQETTGPQMRQNQTGKQPQAPATPTPPAPEQPKEPATPAGPPVFAIPTFEGKDCNELNKIRTDLLKRERELGQLFFDMNVMGEENVELNFNTSLSDANQRYSFEKASDLKDYLRKTIDLISSTFPKLRAAIDLACKKPTETPPPQEPMVICGNGKLDKGMLVDPENPNGLMEQCESPGHFTADCGETPGVYHFCSLQCQCSKSSYLESELSENIRPKKTGTNGQEGTLAVTSALLLPSDRDFIALSEELEKAPENACEDM